MVKLAVVAVFLAGCLGKPGFTSTGSDSDGGVHIDGAPNPACGDRKTFPIDLFFDGPPRIGDVNGDGRDDLIVYGHTNDVQNATAYLMLGTDELDLTCYDQAFTFKVPAAILDVWIGDVTGDGHPDIAMFGRTGEGGGIVYQLRLVPSTSTAGAFGAPFDTTIGANRMYAEVQGGAPRFITGFLKDGVGHLIFGGLAIPYGETTVPTTGGLKAPTVSSTEITLDGHPSQNPQQIWSHPPYPGRLLVATQAGLRAADYLSTNDTDLTWELRLVPELTSPARFTDNQFALRFGRYWHRPFAPDVSIAMISDDTNYYVVTYDEGPEFVINKISNTADVVDFTRDLAIGQLGVASATEIDVIALSGSETEPGHPHRMSIHADLKFGGPQFDPRATMQLELDHGEFLAVGDFSKTTSDDEILLLDKISSSQGVGTCYRVASNNIVPCSP